MWSLGPLALGAGPIPTHVGVVPPPLAHARARGSGWRQATGAGPSPMCRMQGLKQLEASLWKHPRKAASLATGPPKPTHVPTTFCDQPAALGSIFSLSPRIVKVCPRGPGIHAVIFTVSRKHRATGSVSPQHTACVGPFLRSPPFPLGHLLCHWLVNSSKDPGHAGQQ